jgi:hypothetical protein
MKFYTYAHYKPDGELFYIGKGNGNRAYNTRYSQRNIYWKRVVEKYGKPTVKILANWNTEEEAFDHEKLLISCFRDMGYKLANITSGGDGVCGIKWSEESRKKLSNSKMGVKFIGRGASSTKKGDKLSEPHANKLREHLKLARLKIDHSKIHLPKATCLICKKSGTYNGMARFHFNNCKGIKNENPL